MRIEISTTYKHFLSAEEAILECYSLGFSYMQLGAAHKKADIDLLKKLKEELHLKYSMHAPFPNTIEVGEVNTEPTDNKDVFLNSLRVANKLGADPIVVHPGTPLEHENGVEELKEFVRDMERLASKYDLTVCLENKTKKKKFARNLQNIADILDEMGSENLGMCFDTSHARTTCDTEEEVFELFKQYFEYIKAVHLVDTHGKTDEHLPPSYGKVAIEQIISYCVKKNYMGPLTFEVHNVPEEMVIEGHRFVRQALSEDYYDKNVEGK
ncbi:MAG: sugar phosphate isomerase/epimerase family protein [Candidatus Aenigmatarchaeota archaeon]